MTGPPGFLEFFILEASEYVEQLDGILLGGGPGGPDAEAVQRVSRALRGTATMAKLTSFAELAAAVERVGRAMRDGSLHWDPGLGGVLVASVDDLKTLLHSARNWGPADDQRAGARCAELARFAPPAAPIRASTATHTPGSQSHPTPASGTSFLATEAANIAAGLELLTTRAGDPETASNVLRRVRALRGVAAVKEVAPLADALEATEEAARGFESGDDDMSSSAKRLLEAAAGYLRSISAALRVGDDVDAATAVRDAFTSALDAWTAGRRDGERERVIPIAELFYHDGQPDVVETSENPPTSALERFRLELVSLGEHLRQVLDAARHATDAASTKRARRELRRALGALQSAAESFAQRDVAEFIRGHAASAEQSDFLGFAALDDLADVVTDPGERGERLASRVHEVAGGRRLSSAIGAGLGAETPPNVQAVEPPAAARRSSVSPPEAPRPSAVTAPRDRAPTPPTVAVLDSVAAAMIDSSIAAIEALSTQPLSEPKPIPEDTVVPIESLLYRGRAALDRALEIRDELRRGGAVYDAVALEELLDLLELAHAE